MSATHNLGLPYSVCPCLTLNVLIRNRVPYCVLQYKLPWIRYLERVYIWKGIYIKLGIQKSANSNNPE